MTTKELETMPKALRELASQIQSPDNVPAMCLRDAAAMIESLRMQLADASVSPKKGDWINPIPECLSAQDMIEAAKRRDAK